MGLAVMRVTSLSWQGRLLRGKKEIASCVKNQPGNHNLGEENGSKQEGKSTTKGVERKTFHHT